MIVFVTGTTRTISKAETKGLLALGHQVLGFARRDTGAEELKSLGADVQRGTLTDLNVLARQSK